MGDVEGRFATDFVGDEVKVSHNCRPSDHEELHRRRFDIYTCAPIFRIYNYDPDNVSGSRCYEQDTPKCLADRSR